MKTLKQTKEFFMKLYDKYNYGHIDENISLKGIKGLKEHLQNLDYMISNLPPKEELQKDERITSKELGSIATGTSQFCAKYNLVEKVLTHGIEITDKDHLLDAVRVARAYFIIK